ncbi:MAG: ABC transporter permease, partial [Verrucomicrobiales bacterium]|nr:ABC transporter permease [Verrucomicrobiales bacterium]
MYLPLAPAFRQWTRNPGLLLVAVLTLALGIGASTAIFSVIHGILIRPFPYPDSEQVMFVSGGLRDEPGASFPLSLPELHDFQEPNPSFSSLGGAMDGQFTVTGIDQPTQVKGGYVSPQTLELLGVPPAAGRLFQPTDDQPGAEPVCVLADRAWSRFFQRRPDILGKSVLLNGRSFTVVGLMPPDFKFWDAYLYVPLAHGIPAELRLSRTVRFGIWGIGRLAPGITPETAATHLSTLLDRAKAATPGTPEGATIRVTPLAQNVGNRIRGPLYLLFGAVGCVLLIACVNVTNLLIARGVVRQREFAVRTAVGAGRRELIAQLLWESLPLALLSAAVGLLLALGILRALLVLIPAELIPAEATLRLNTPVLVFSGLIALASTTLSSLVPALQISPGRVHDSLRESQRGTGGLRSSRLRSGLIVAEVTLALALLIGAGLLVRNLTRIAATDPGFHPQNLLIARIDLPESRYASH